MRSSQDLSIDVIQYLETINFDLSTLEITLQVVESILAKHGFTFATTTLPANLNDDVRLDYSNLFKYLIDNRYGYCFHHNIVAYEALRQLGFNVELLAANMTIEPNYTTTRSLATHACILLTLQDQRYLLDPGWGCSSLKPLSLDEKDTDKTAYHVSKRSDNKYALIENRNKKVWYEFDCTPVKINDFDQALKFIMSNQHDFYNMFFYIKKLPNGDIQHTVDRKYTHIDSKGNRKIELFDQPASVILRDKFKLKQDHITRLTQSSYSNSAIKKIIVEFNLPKKVYQNIYSFLSKDITQQVQQLSKNWQENCNNLKPPSPTLPGL